MQLLGQALATRLISGVNTCAWLSEVIAHQEWDDFLQRTPLGHFQQSSAWARVKAYEGWKSFRIVVSQEGNIVGGFQTLYRKREWLREGLLSKGPVCSQDDEKLRDWLVELVELSAKKFGIHLLISQSPDEDVHFTSLAAKRGHLENSIAPLLIATLCVPLGDPSGSAATRMRRSVRWEANRAKKGGVIVREGTSADIPLFFRLMRETCERRNTAPNPSSERHLAELWTAFDQNKLARMTIAECEGRPIASLLSLRYGDRVTQWKKGWSGEFRDRHPTTLLSFESIEWAEKTQAKKVDFVGCGVNFARTLISGSAFSAEQKASRYFFLVGFAAEAVLLPAPKVFVRNFPLKIAYRLSAPFLQRWLHIPR